MVHIGSYEMTTHVRSYIYISCVLDAGSSLERAEDGGHATTGKDLGTTEWWNKEETAGRTTERKQETRRRQEKGNCLT